MAGRAETGGMTAREVLILLFDGVQSLDVTGPLEVFTGASRYQQERGRGPAYRVRTASLTGAAVTTSSGLTLVPGGSLADLPAADDAGSPAADDAGSPADASPGAPAADDGNGPAGSMAGAPALDTLVVPGGDAGDARAELAAWLRASTGRTRRVTSVCTGAFLLAEAGLLAGRRATTHWAYSDELARRFPDVCVDAEPIYIRDGNVTTSAGVTAGIDLALALVEEDIGRAAALTVARHLVVFLRRPGGQAQFSAQLRAQAARRVPLREVQQWITEHPGADLSVETLAARAGLSPRQFARAFAAETGVPPGQHVAATRLEAARRMLEDGAPGIEQVARACGYGHGETMRRAFVRALGVPPASYRHRF
jgi:transcriptional regulator GlxA family with amidase domain